MAKTKKEVNWKNLLITAGIVLLIFMLWDSIFIYPFKIFTVYMHEISHGIAAILTGGTLHSIEIGVLESGLATTSGGNYFIVLNAGYLGSLFFGCLLLWLSTYKKIIKPVLGILALMFFIVFVLYIDNFFGYVITLIFLALLTLLIFKGKGWMQYYFLKATGLISCVYVLYDVFVDVFLIGGGDASALAELTGVPAFVWGIIWMMITIVVLWVFAKGSFKEKAKEEDYLEE